MRYFMNFFKVAGEEGEQSCEAGCRAFLNPSEKNNVAKVSTFGAVWGPRVDNASFCNEGQSGAAYCRVGAPPPRKCRGTAVDLLKGHEALWARVQPKVADLVTSTKRMGAEAEAAG